MTQGSTYNFILSASLILFGLVLSCENRKIEEVSPLRKSWEKAVPHQEIPEGLLSIQSEYCGSCHNEHYKEWQLSTHAQAWTDQQFQAELKKESSPYLCINCHIPLQNQQEYIVDGLINGDVFRPSKKLNSNFDRDLREEGINCAACHVRDGYVIGSTGSLRAPHKTKKDADFLSEKLCMGCHNASARVTAYLVCSFETGDEWSAYGDKTKKNCITCHMEDTEREVVKGYGVKKGHYHFFPGSGIPKCDSVKPGMLNGLAFYPGNLATRIRKNDSLKFSLRIVNEFAGHKIPTGDPERFLIVSMILRDEAGKVLISKADTIGEKWQWYPEAVKLAENNLKPGEEKIFHLGYQATQKGDLHLEVEVSKHRLRQRAAEYNGLKANYPLSITVFNKVFVTTIF